MAKDNEKKDLDQLINSMFRGHRLNTVSAEDYLEQVRKSQDEMQSGLDQAQENQKKAEDTLNTTENAVDQLNAILRRQSEDLQKQSEALRDQSRDLGFTDQDFAKLQAEVQKDFGISVDVENQQKRQAQDLQAVLNGMQEAAAQTGTVVLGQESFLADLSRAFFRPLASGQSEDRLRNVFVISGPAGSGRHTLAAQMAAALVCSAQPQLRPCGRCSHCRKAAGGIHPDITVIAGSGGKPITVDQVRALRTDAYVRPNEAERKVYLLERADRMNASAQNAMLKLLEDGPAYAVFFLLAENGSALLPTVRSRCETLELAPVSPAQAEEWLAKAFPGRTAEEIRRAALECQGILGRAAALLEGGQEEDGLEETARSLSAALEGEDELALFEATQALDKLSREELTAVLDRTLIQIGARLPGSQRPRRLLAAAELLRRLRDGADLNANPGQVAGWLCAGMFLRP